MPVEIAAGARPFSNMAIDWLAVQPPTHEKRYVRKLLQFLYRTQNKHTQTRTSPTPREWRVLGASFEFKFYRGSTLPRAFNRHSADSFSAPPDLHTTQTCVREVHASVVTEWPSACLLKLLPRGHQRETAENLEWKKFPTLSIFVPPTPFMFKSTWFFKVTPKRISKGNWKNLNERRGNFIKICPTDPIQILNLHEFFQDFVSVLKMLFLTWSKKNRPWHWGQPIPHLQSTAPHQIVWKLHLHPQYSIFH